MTKIFVLFPILFCVAIGYAQQNRIDSLKNAVRKDNDAGAYVALALVTADKDSSYLLLQRALIYVNDPVLESTIYTHISQWELDKGFYSLAQKSAFKSLEIGIALNDSSKISLSYKLLGLIAMNTGLYEKAVDYNQKGIMYCGKTNARTLAAISNNLGLTYFHAKDIYKAIGLHQENCARAIKRGDSILMAAAHNNLGTCFLELKSYDSAFKHISKTLQINTLMKDSIGLMYDTKLTGEYFYLQHQFAKAKSYFYQSLSLDQKFGRSDDGWNSSELPLCYQAMEDIYSHEHNTDSSQYFKDKILSYYKDLLDKQKQKSAGFVFSNQEEQLLAITEKQKQIRRGQKEYYGIALALLLCMVGYFMLTHKDAQRKYTPYISMVILILTFEFLLIVLDPFISRITNDEPLLNFGANVFVAMLLIPIQKFGENLFKQFALDVRLKKIES